MIDDRLHPPRRRHDDRVAIAACVRGRQRPRDAVVAPVGHDEAADLVERCVRRDDADRRVLDRERFCTEDVGWRRRPIRLAAIVDVSHCVHGDEGAHDEVAVAHGRAAEPPGRACSRPRHFPMVAPVPAPMRPTCTAPPRASAQAA